MRAASSGATRATTTRTRNYVYCCVISVQPGIQLKAVAYKSGMADSEVAKLGPNEFRD